MRYVIYATVYGAIGICVGLAMAYVTKDTSVIGAVGGPKGIRLTPQIRKPVVVTAPSDEGEAEVPSLEDLAE
jgi:hypothetical protein